MRPYYHTNSFEDFIATYKFFEDLQKSKKDDKKEPPKNPDAWTPLDYMTAIFFFWSLSLPITVTLGLIYLTEFIKAVNHT